MYIAIAKMLDGKGRIIAQAESRSDYPRAASQGAVFDVMMMAEDKKFKTITVLVREE